tara:strand:+ start:2062 stop:2355 length:294 start_codon:yes stop_codon:yes gene_type:complete
MQVPAMKPEIWQEQPGKPETSHFVVAPSNWEEYQRLKELAKKLRNAAESYAERAKHTAPSDWQEYERLMELTQKLFKAADDYEIRAKRMERPGCKTS